MGTNKQSKPTKPAKPVKKAVKKAPAKPVKKAPAKAVKKAPAKAAKKAPAKAAKKAPAKKAPAKKAPAKPVKKAPAKPVKKAAPVPAKKAAAVKAPGKPFPKKENPVPAVVEPPKNLPKNAAATAAADGFQRRLTLPPPAKIEKRTSKAGTLKPLRDIPTPLVAAATEAPWSNSVSKELIRLRRELELAEAQAEDLLQDSGDGAGDDQADAGAKTFEREHEISLVYNARDMVMQTEHALDRITAGSYGKCEDCGNPIGKARLQVFPRATLCMICKQKEERR
jgi:RNA polymerase-binding transcription factor DksA